MIKIQKIGIIGGGAWGTALAATAKRAGRDVVIWAREEKTVSDINNNHENNSFLSGVELDGSIKATLNLKDLKDSDAVFIATPAQHLRTACKEISHMWEKGKPVVICAKGIEIETGLLMSDVVKQELPFACIAILSGPTFAYETAIEVPTAITLACENEKTGQELVKAIGTLTFRPYMTNDVIGSQVGGAVKNVMAIARGIAEGRNFGDNACAALVTRGLAEIVRLAVAMGGKPETLMGLSGLGDLVLTANSMQSRNFSLGTALGKGQSLDEILKERNSVAEGIYTAKAVVNVAEKYNVEMPICEAVNNILSKNADIDKSIKGLLSRPFKTE